MKSDIPLKPGRELWIDVARGIAIFAVILDHVTFIRQQFLGDLIYAHTAFSVPWFIFLAGITSLLSTTRVSSVLSKPVYLTYWKKKLPLVGMYLVASVFSTLWYGPPISLPNLFWSILLFGVSPPYYFFFILFQLYLLFPLFSEILKRIGNVKQFFFIFIIICLVGWYFSLVMNYPWFFPPWKMPFGGTYAPLFFLGMAYARWKKQIHPFIRIPAISIFLSFEAMLIVMRGLYFARTPIITLFGWSLGFLFIIKMVIEALPNFSMIWRTLAFFGKHSLPIFLFHYITVQNFASYLPGNWIYFIFLLLLAAGVPLLIEYAFNMSLQGIVNVKKKLALSYK